MGLTDLWWDHLVRLGEVAAWKWTLHAVTAGCAEFWFATPLFFKISYGPCLTSACIAFLAHLVPLWPSYCTLCRSSDGSGCFGICLSP